jgi:hypothetical protein
MNEPINPGSRKSQKAWPEFDPERPVWIPCPAAFPKDFDRETWARNYATRWCETSGLDYGERQIRGLAKMLVDLQDILFGAGTCHVALIHLPPPEKESPPAHENQSPLARIAEPLPVGVGVWQAVGERSAQLRLLSNADDPEATEPPVVEEIWTEHLGAGLRTLRYPRLDDGSLFGALDYAFRSEQFETDIRFFTSSPDLSRLQSAIPDIEELVRATSLRPLTKR